MPAIAAIANGIGEVDRQYPQIALGAAWTKADFVNVLGNVAAFLREEQRGFPPLHLIIKGRKQ